jgi:hypothetical protein
MLVTCKDFSEQRLPISYGKQSYLSSLAPLKFDGFNTLQNDIVMGYYEYKIFAGLWWERHVITMTEMNWDKGDPSNTTQISLLYSII